MTTLFLLTITFLNDFSDKIFQYNDEDSVCAAWNQAHKNKNIMSEEAYELSVSPMGFLQLVHIDCKNRP